MMNASTSSVSGPQRTLGFWPGVTLVAASMIGSGILTAPGFTVQSVGSHWLGIVLWIVGGVLALCGSLTLVEMATALPKVGGEYVYVNHAFGGLWGFVYGWGTLLVGFAGPIATVALTTVKFAMQTLPAEYALS